MTQIVCVMSLVEWHGWGPGRMVLVVVCKTRKTCQGVAYLVLAGMTRLEIHKKSIPLYLLLGAKGWGNMEYKRQKVNIC